MLYTFAESGPSVVPFDARLVSTRLAGAYTQWRANQRSALRGSRKTLAHLQTCRFRPDASRCTFLAVSPQHASQLLVEPPHSRLPLLVISLHLFILRPSDRGDRLVLCCASCNLFLHDVADIHQHLSKLTERLSAFAGVGGNGTMSRHENLGPEGFDRIQRLQPVEAV